MKVVALCRLSTDEQAHDGRAGLLRQKEDVRVTAQKFNLDVERMFEVIDVSGTVFTTTAHCREMLAVLQQPHIAGLILPALDRLMRPNDFTSYGIYDFFLNN